MMKMIKAKKTALYGLILVGGIFLGRLLFGGAEQQAHVPEATEAVWTCAMHPQIRQDKPGKCPLCAMDLIPVKSVGASDQPPDNITLSKEAVALANIQTTVVRRSNPVKEIRLYGTVQADERLSQSQVAHVGGRIEKLYVNFTGERVRKGQIIASIYSPDLLNAQQELLEAAKMQVSQPALLVAAREKLRRWQLSDAQIAAVERSGDVSPVVDVIAAMGGIVSGKKVEQGDYLSQGSVLFDLIDLSSVWVLFDVYEADLSYLKPGDKVTYTLQALPWKTFSGKITFIDPVLDKTTRTAKVRVETANPKLELKPEMYVDAVITTSLQQHSHEIVIPKTAVLWTGKRSVVYVKQPRHDMPVFAMREIELGASLGDAYVALAGIAEGEELVTNGAFAIDASAQLEGKRSMMNNDVAIVSEEHAMLSVQGFCEMCKERIEKTATNKYGVVSAAWNIETKQLHLIYDANNTTLDAIGKAIAEAGHDAGKYKATDKVYNALPDCCKYRE